MALQDETAKPDATRMAGSCSETSVYAFEPKSAVDEIWRYFDLWILAPGIEPRIPW